MEEEASAPPAEGWRRAGGSRSARRPSCLEEGGGGEKNGASSGVRGASAGDVRPVRLGYLPALAGTVATAQHRRITWILWYPRFYTRYVLQ